jgi:hypothetical protein
MLSAIITPGDPRRLPALLAALTPAAVDGLVADLRIIGEGPLVEALCAETGAEAAADFASAVSQSRSDWLLVAPPAFRPREDWLEALGDHLRGGGRAAVVRGRGLFAPQALIAPKAVLLQHGLGGLRHGRQGVRVRL